MFSRPELLNSILSALENERSVALLGARQVGKTSIAREVARQRGGVYLDLESPDTLLGLSDPLRALGAMAQEHALIVLDEVQRLPELFAVLRVLIDRSPRNGQFLLLGSASPTLLRQSSESLAGRMQLIEMAGFSLAETGGDSLYRLWLRGEYPRSFLAGSDGASFTWRGNYMANVVNRDMPQFGLGLPATTLFRLWRMLAHYHGQVFNSSELARALGLSDTSVRRYLDVLTDMYLVRQLQPWYANLGKRQIKAPKLYLRDSGLWHWLMDIPSLTSLLTNPKLGASWEGFALEQVLRHAQPQEAYFWATHGGAELDLLMLRANQRVGVQFKFADAPKITKSMRVAIDDLKLDALYIVYPGEQRFALESGIELIPLSTIARQN